jgi:hypothetical protein
MSQGDSAVLYDRNHDWRETTPTAAIVTAVASVEECTTTDLPPLYDIVDPDALSRLVGSPAHYIEVRFEYVDYRVSVDSTGAVRVLAQ